MSLSGLNTAAIARALAQMGDRPDDHVEAFFERRERLELAPEGEVCGLRLRREEGLAVRLVRDRRTWLASRDEISADALADALRQTARVLPVAPYPLPALTAGPWSESVPAAALHDFTPALHRAVRRRHVAFPLRISVRHHRRWVQVVGPRLVPEAERESFYSIVATMPSGRYGALFTQLDAAAIETVAGCLVSRFQARQAPQSPSGRRSVVLAPAAAAVLLHEAVAHALEADVLALGGGRPESAVGLRLGSAGLHVLDDPGAAPPRVARRTDDEGNQVCRRWLLRDGVVEQPLADARWANLCPALVPGAGRRGSRHEPPGPRSSYLEMLPGELTLDELLSEAENGLFIEEVSRGHLDPLNGTFLLDAPYARRIRGGAIADPVGRLRLWGTVAELLASVSGIGREVEVAGAGWCAKGGTSLPVWASAPALRLAEVEVRG